MTQEKSEEYQEVAALVCMEIDILFDISQQEGITVEELKEGIIFLHNNKEEIIKDAEKRKMRYNAGCLLFEAAKAGLVKNNPVV